MQTSRSREWTVELADVPVLVRAEEDRRREALDRLMDGVPESRSPAAICVEYRQRAAAFPRRAPDLVADEIRVWREPDRTVVADEAGAVAAIQTASACIGGDVDLLEFRYRRLFHLAIAHLLAAHDRFLLHAVGIVPGEVAVLGLGDSGSGKSTLALAAVEAGHRILADDMVAVRLAGARVEAAGLGMAASVPGDLGGAVAGTAECLERDPRGRRRLPPAMLHRGWFPVVTAMALGHSPSPSGTLGRIDAQRCLQTVLRSFAATADPRCLRRFFGCAAALARLPAWELLHGSQTSTRLAVAQRLLQTSAEGRRAAAPEPAPA